jgi:kynureninase
MPPERRGGFLAIRMPGAMDIVKRLRTHAVFADVRGDVLRLGPAPYLRDQQLADGVEALGRCV